MSLQVWLPLTGHTNNQGLNNQTITWTTTPTYTASGKLGQALARGGAKLPASMAGSILNNTAITIACWLYVNADAGDTTNRAMVFGNDPMSSAGGRQFSIFRYPHADDIHLSWQSYNNGTYSTILASVDSGVLTARAWNHICVTYQNPQVILYVNGVVINRYNAAMNASSFNFDTNLIYNSTSHYINDFRIYDHCLSQKEVRELSKALVLHYKLDDPCIEATTNLITTADPLSSTCYNGATNKYGYGANTDIYKETTTWEGQTGTKVHMGTNGLAANPYVYFSNLYTSNGTNSPAYKTISFDYYATRGTWLNIYKLGSGSGTCNWRNITTGQSGSYTNSSNAIVVVPNHWNHIEATLHGTTDADAQWGYCILGGQHTSDTNNFWFFANVQIETRDYATPYVGGPGITRAGEPCVYDSSGYGYNGALTSGRSLTMTSDSPRYALSTTFPRYGENGQCVDMTNTTLLPAITSGTVSWWVKYTSTQNLLLTGNNDIYYYLAASQNNAYYNSRITVGTWYVDGLPVSSAPKPVTGAWHMYAVTGVNFTGWTTFRLNRYDGSNAWSLNGSLSDFRIYATSLSAADVLELYHTEAAVGRGGEVFAREVIER